MVYLYEYSGGHFMIVKNTLDIGITNELINKVKKLHFALVDAESIIKRLEEENQRLRNALEVLSPNEEESIICSTN